MNPGTLDRKIQIQRQLDGLPMVTADGTIMTTADGEQMITGSRKGRFGAELSAWGLWHERMASKKSKSGSEEVEAGREIGRQVVRFRMRYTAGLALTDRIVCDELAYDIIDVEEIGRRILQDVHCVLHSNTRPA